MNIWTGLLFLDGAVADAGLARDLAGTATAELARWPIEADAPEALPHAAEAARACAAVALCPSTGAALR